MDPLADHDFSRRGLHLRMAFQAEIIVPFDEQLGVDRAVRLMTGYATFAQGFVFVQHRLALFPVAGGARLVQSRHRQRARRFQNVTPMWIVALHAIHLPLDHRMMLGQVEFCVNFQVALETGRGIFAWIDNEFAASPAALNVFAAGSVTRFAT